MTAREAYTINYNSTQKEGVKKNNITEIDVIVDPSQ